MADDCLTVVRHMGFSSVNLLGHGMGGLVAQNCAVRYTGIVDKLVLVSTAARNSPRNNALFSDWATSLEAEIEPALWFRNMFIGRSPGDFSTTKRLCGQPCAWRLNILKRN